VETDPKLTPSSPGINDCREALSDCLCDYGLQMPSGVPGRLDVPPPDIGPPPLF